MRSEHEEYNQAFHDTDAENASHYVYHEIQKLYTGTQNIEDVRKRWIWELLQNAHDARDPNGNKLIVEVEYRTEEKLIFLHNGRGFKPNEIAHIVKSGTTKDSDKKTQGKFGRGFLTTHLLSSTVDIAGLLDTDKEEKWFDFTLERNHKPQEALVKSLKQSQKAFIGSIKIDKPAIPDPFTTQFIFPIHKSGAKEAVKSGLDTLEQCAPYVIAFNPEFSSINIKRPDRTLCFEYFPSDVSQIGQITVSENKNGEFSKRQYLLASSEEKTSEEKTSVAVPIELNGDSSISSSVEDTPRLYSAFPLVGTDSYSFPAVINDPGFSLPPERDGIQLDGGDPASLNNKTIVEESCEMLVRLLKDTASKHGNHEHLHRWAEIPNVDRRAFQTESELKNCLKNLIEQIIHADVLLTQSGELTTPKNAILPEVENEGNIEVLWDLLNDWKEYREKLPRRGETVGWYKAVKSWEVVWGTVPTEMIISMTNVHRLVALLVKKCSCLEDLQNELQEGVSAVDWLNRLYTFLQDNELLDNKMRKNRIFLDQDNKFKHLDQLHRDAFGDEKLKDIAELLGWPIKSELYNTHLTTLDKIERHTDDWNQDYVVRRLLIKLKEHAKDNPDNPDDKFKRASVDLFAWIVSEKKYSLLSDFPMFSEIYDSGKTKVISLLDPNPDDSPDKERPLAPVKSWKSDLWEYDELFPPRFIIAKDFFQAVENQDNIWEWLEDNGFIRKDVIFQYDSEVSFEDFLPKEPLSDGDHVSEKKVRVTKIAFLTESKIGIIERIRKSSRRARKFWDFLTKCVVMHDPEGLELTELVCANCDDNHQYYPAEWLEPVVDRSWIPIDKNTSDILKADNLANLFEEDGWDPGALNQNDPISKLLKAVGISHLDLIRATFVPSGDLETVDNVITEMLRKSRGNVNHLNHAIKYIETVTSNENLPQDLENLLEATDGDISEVTEIAENLKEDEDFKQVVDARLKERRNIKQNRSLGITVEEIVGDHLKKLNENFEVEVEDFEVESIHKGADYVITLEINQKWWIEVKSARTDSVKMSSDQAQNAKERGENFLLCVVPLEPGNTNPDPETVKESMRFIADINNRVTPLCKKIDELKDVQTNINAESSSDVELVIEGGKASVIVKKSVWESDEAFPLGKLAEYLR